MKREPVAIATALSVTIKAILLAFMAFGVEMTAPQLAAVMFAVDSILGFVLVLVVRPQVVSTETADRQIIAAQALPTSMPAHQAILIAKEQAAR